MLSARLERIDNGWHQKTKKLARRYLRSSARKKGTDSTFLYGCARTDNAMHAKSKRDFEVVRATYKKQGTGQCCDARPVPK